MTTITPIARHAPYQPPLAHKVRITTAYTPACATNVRATIERVQAHLAARAAGGKRKARTLAARHAAQHDLFAGTVICLSAVAQRRAA